MRSVAIVGAGQAGLLLALGLLARGYHVRLYSQRTPHEIREGKVLSSQAMFDRALQVERDLELNHWEKWCPPIEGVGLAVPHPEQAGAKAIDWTGDLDRPAQAVDQRIKMPAWMELFAQRGGELVIQDVGLRELEELTTTFDLVVVAAGKGEIVRHFERDPSRSPYDQPMRALALTYVHGLQPDGERSRVAFNLIPGVGEYFVFPALTTSGPCSIMVFEGVPGGPMDNWHTVHTPQEHLHHSLDILRRFLPWEAARCEKVQLTDDNAILCGRFAPTVRHPVLRLPSGQVVLGMGDAVAVNDPITGQGSNNAAKAAKVYLEAIVSHGEKPFDRAFMERTFDTWWEDAKWVIDWTNSLLSPPPPHILQFLGAAGEQPRLASLFANGFNHPKNFFPWWLDAEQCQRVINWRVD